MYLWFTLWEVYNSCNSSDTICSNVSISIISKRRKSKVTSQCFFRVIVSMLTFMLLSKLSTDTKSQITTLLQ